MLLALVDAETIVRSARVTARYLILPLTGIVLLYWILKPNMATKLLWGTVAIMLLWSIDGLAQFITDQNILGRESSHGGRVTGMFYPWPHLGVVLAILLPVYLEGLYQISAKYRWTWLLILPVLAAILLGGGRSSWMLTIVALLSYLIYYFLLGRRFSWYRGLIVLILSISLIISIILNVDWLLTRVQQSFGIFSSNHELVNRATSARLPVWSTATNMASKHWFNGVGARAFQSSYDDYSITPNDPFKGVPAGHPHLFLLEVAAETGFIGIIGYFGFLIFLFRQIKAASKTEYSHSIPWALAAFVAAFPLSSTMSFYASFSSCLIWFLLIVFIGLSNKSEVP